MNLDFGSPESSFRSFAEKDSTSEVELEQENEAVVLYPPQTKNFWRTGSVIEFNLVEHIQHMIIEVVSNLAVKDIEAPRIYLSATLLRSKFCEETIIYNVGLKKSSWTHHAKIAPDIELREKVIQELCVQYVKDRLVIPLDGNFDLWLAILPSDLTEFGKLDVLCGKPRLLKKYEFLKTFEIKR
jgi:hypothetical protein